MNYQGTLESGEQVYIGNEDAQTRVQVQSGQENHSESQGSSFETGKWKSAPQLFKTSNGAVLEVKGESGTIYLELRDGSLHHLEKAPRLDDATEIKLKETDEFPESKPLEPLKPMEPMKPMAPMKPMK